MKHSTEELLFAAAIRERAASIRTSKTRGMSEQDAEEFMKKPANDLIKEALEEFSRIADVVSKLRADDPPAP